jgi:hypothetical protein
MITSTDRNFKQTRTTHFTKKPASLRILVTDNDTDVIVSDVTFKVGDTAEWGSYNLRYLGTIVSITPRSVVIDRGPCYSQKVRLKHEQFAWRNEGFDLEKVRRENYEASLSI